MMHCQIEARRAGRNHEKDHRYGGSIRAWRGAKRMRGRKCADQNASYDDTWNCVKNKIRGKPIGNADVMAHYLAAGDLIAEKVRNHELDDAQAKLALADELRTDMAAIDERDERSRRSYAGLTAAGVAILAASRPPPSATCVTTGAGNVATTVCQ